MDDFISTDVDSPVRVGPTEDLDQVPGFCTVGKLKEKNNQI